ncbi:MAG: HEPN domain-containing protein, partial [Acidobacteria bacterium]|nr:HEPN domain-containing protein [Acidobacteriota bacterium]
MSNVTRRTGAEAKQMMQWLWWAGSDYRAARWLLRGGLLLQGAAFANTAIEKYLKTSFVYLGARIPHNHNVTVLFQTLKAQTQTNIAINGSFLRLLEKSYKLRYPDVEEGYNLALNQCRLLVELDR